MRDGWVGGGSWVDKWSLWKSTKAWKSNGVNNFRWISIDSRNPSDIVLWHFTNIDLTFSVQPVFIFHSSKQMVASWWLVWIHCREPKSTFPNFTNQGQDIKGYGTEFRSCSLSLLQHFMPYFDLHLGMLSPALCSVWLGYLVGLLLWTVSWMCLEIIFPMPAAGWLIHAMAYSTLGRLFYSNDTNKTVSSSGFTIFINSRKEQKLSAQLEKWDFFSQWPCYTEYPATV